MCFSMSICPHQIILMHFLQQVKYAKLASHMGLMYFLRDTGEKKFCVSLSQITCLYNHFISFKMPFKVDAYKWSSLMSQKKKTVAHSRDFMWPLRNMNGLSQQFFRTNLPGLVVGLF